MAAPTRPTSNPFIHVPGQQGTSTYNDPVTHPVTNPFIHVEGQQGNPNGTDTTPTQTTTTPAQQPYATTPLVQPDWKQLVKDDPEGKAQQAYLDRDNTLTTAALKQAWLRNTQSSQDSYNSHGGLFSGAMVNAGESIKNQYTADLDRQALNYDKGGHDIGIAVLNRLRDALVKTGTTEGTTL